MTAAIPSSRLPTVVKAYRVEDRHRCRQPPSYTSCVDCVNRLGLDHFDGYALIAAHWATDDVIDWPAGGIPADGNRVMQLANDNLRPRAIYRMSHGGLAVGQVGDSSITKDVIDPPDWDRGYRVIGEDGTWPTWWPTYASAMYVAGLRQRIRSLPNEGPHLLGPMKTSGNSDGYTVLMVNRRHFTRFGYSAGTGKTANQAVAGHRVSFIAFYGYAPETVDHLCKQKLCCYPGHLGDATWNEQLAREHLGADYGYWLRRTEPRQQPTPKSTRKHRHQDRQTPNEEPATDLQQGLAQLAAKYGHHTR